MSNESRASSFEAQPGKGTRAGLLSGGFVVLLVSQAAFGYAFSSFFLLPKYLAVALDASASEVGLLMSVSSIGAAISMIVMGIWVDRFGRRRFLIAGGVLMGCASASFVWVEEIGPLIYGLRLLQGLAFAMTYVAGSALTVDKAPPEKLAQALGYFGTTMLSMNAVAPVVVEGLALEYGWGPAFATSAVGGFLCAGLAWFVKESEGKAPAPKTRTRMIDVAREPWALSAAAVMVCVGSGFIAMFSYHQLFAIELGMTTVQGFFVAYAACAIFARTLLGGIGDRFGRRRISAFTLVIYAGSVFGMSQLETIGLMPLGGALGLAHGLFYPCYSAWAVDRGSAADRGKILALLQCWWNVGIAVASYALGVLADARGFEVVFLVSGSLVALAVGLVAGTRGRSEPQAPLAM